MTESNKDPEEWRAVIGNKRHKDELAKQFKDNDSPLKIAIVVDMWLTGFDVPSLATMYVYKPMHGYNLRPSPVSIVFSLIKRADLLLTMWVSQPH
jgi:type I restriction enzyme R subunit